MFASAPVGRPPRLTSLRSGAKAISALPRSVGGASGPALPQFAAWLGGLIFALHPVCVESVAWISEEKNTLSTVFYLLAALTYFRFYESRQGGRRPSAVAKALADGPGGGNLDVKGADRSAATYCLATFLFILALLSKSVTSTLPAAILVVMWWKHGRLEWRRDFMPLLPWLALGLGMGLFTAWVERNYLGAEGATFNLNFLERCLLAGRVICFYLGKVFWPRNLVFIYPHWRVSDDLGWQYLFPPQRGGGLGGFMGAPAPLSGRFGGISFLCWNSLSRPGLFQRLSPSPFPTWPITFNISPAWGWWQWSRAVGEACWRYCTGGDRSRRSTDHGRPASDREGEISSNEANAPPWIAGRWSVIGVPSLYALAIILIAILGGSTWRQSRIYRDAETLYRVTLEKNPGCWLAAYNLGVVLEGQDRIAESIGAYEWALREKPDLPDAHNNLGIIYANAGKLREAMAQYRLAIADGEKEASSGVGPARAGWYRSGEASATYNLGNALSKSGREAEAMLCYREAIRLKPGFDEAYAALGRSFSGSGKPDQAILFFEKALRANPRSPQLHNDLGVTMHEVGRKQEAAEQFEAALRLQPDFADAEVNLGNIRREEGRTAEAIACYQQALRIKPQSSDVDFHLAIVLAESGRLPEAIGYYEAALRIKPDAADINYDLGVALREVGRVSEAIVRYERALRLRPNYPEAENDLGIALAQSGRLDESIAHFEAALRLKPDYGEADNNLALVLKALGRTIEAKARQDEADRLLGRPPRP